MKPTANEILQKILDDFQKKYSHSSFKMQIPPPSFFDMEAIAEDYVANKSLTVSFPVMERQTNPAGFMQGGYIAAAFDNTFGPLSFIVAKKPTTTIDLNVQYIRGVQVGQRVRVTASVVARGFSTISMSAQMMSEKGKLLANSQTNLLIVKI